MTSSLLRVSGILAHVDERAQPDDAEPTTSRRPRDLAISLLVLIIPLVVLVGGYQVLAGRDQPVAIDPTPRLAEAQRAGLDVGLPEGLDAAWVPVSSVFRTVDGGATLRLGYVTPDGESVQLVQSTVPAEQLLAGELTDSAAPSGAMKVNGIDWQWYPGPPGERALVRHGDEVTVIVVGPAAQAELAELAASMSNPRAP